MPIARTHDLDIAYQASGPEDGKPVLLIHGWPDDASTWDGVASALFYAGFRTIVPTLRGFGETRFVSDDTPRTGNSAILAMDMIELMDGLGIERFMVAGHDCWVGRLPTASRCARVMSLQDSHEGAARDRHYPHWPRYVKERLSASWCRSLGTARTA